MSIDLWDALQGYVKFLYFSKEMLPLLQKASTRKSGGMSVSRAAVLNISSMAGSITRTGVEFTQDLIAPGYKISKVSMLIYLTDVPK